MQWGFAVVTDDRIEKPRPCISWKDQKVSPNWAKLLSLSRFVVNCPLQDERSKALLRQRLRPRCCNDRRREPCKDVSKHLGPPAAATNAPSLPAAVDRATFQAELDTLRVWERRTPARVTRSPRPDGGCRWSRSTRRPRLSAHTGRCRSSTPYRLHAVWDDRRSAPTAPLISRGFGLGPMKRFRRWRRHQPLPAV